MKSIAIGLLTFCAVAFPAANEGSFTPTSVLAPIISITLGHSTNGNTAEIYRCSAGTETGCLVDVADNTALASLVSSISVATGVFNQVTVTNCTDNGYSAKVKGQVSLGGTTYYTALNTNSNPHAVLSTTSGNLDYASVDFTGCAQTYNLPSELTVTASSTVNISLFLSIKNIAWGRLGTKTIPSGCAESSDAGRSVCIAYPDVAPVLSSASPTLETYHICEGASCAANTASGQVLLLFDGSDNFLGGFTRRLLSENSTTPNVNYDTGLRTFSKVDASTVTFKNYGSSSTTSYVAFGSFSRATHQGTMINEANSNTSITYEAVKQ